MRNPGEDRRGRAAALLAACLALAGLARAGEPDVAALYDVSTQGSTAELKAGQKGKVAIAIVTKGGAHISDEAPLKIELSSKQGKLDKEKLTLADSTARGTKEAPADPRFEVGFTPNTQGPVTVEARLVFFVCTEKLCARQSKSLSIPVQVN